MLKLSIITLLVFVSYGAQACRVIPLEKNKTKYLYKLIKDTPNIYLATAQSASTEDETVTLKVSEVIRGEKKENITLNAVVLDTNAKKDFIEKNTTDYGNHKKAVFWDQIFEGRTTFGTDCRLKPTFQIGSRYLILDREPYQPKSFELVKSLGDEWYIHVKETLYPNLKKKKVKAVNP